MTELNLPLLRALENYQHDEIERILERAEGELSGGNLDEALDVLKTLNAFARFEDTVRLGYIAFRQEPGCGVAQHLAQALIETHRVTEALAILARRTPAWRDPESEIVGRLGRGYKQLYIDARPNSSERRIGDLEKALSYYGARFEESPTHQIWDGDTPPVWEGINMVALLHHAAQRAPQDERTRLESRCRELNDTVRRVTELHRRRSPNDPWLTATLMEAYVLDLAKHREAAELVRAYVDHEKSTLFQLRSTLRQLREVWELGDGHPVGDALIPVLMGAIARKSGDGKILVPAGAERVWGEETYLDLSTLPTIQQRANGVARIEQMGKGALGTGFLVAPDLLLTARHVVAGQSLSGLRARFSTHDKGRGRVIRLSAVVWQGEVFRESCHDLDAALVRLDEPLDAGSVLPLFDDDRDVVPVTRAYVVGYPDQRTRPQISLHDSKVIDANSEVLQYRTPTNPGSSGSPVLNDEWEVVGVHTLGFHEVPKASDHSEVHAVNQAVRIWRVKEQIGKHSVPTMDLPHVSEAPERGTEGASGVTDLESIVVPGRSPRSSTTEPAKWWRLPLGSTEALPGNLQSARETVPPHMTQDRGRLYFRMATSGSVELDYHGGDQQWKVTRSFGDTIVNRITLGQHQSYILQLEGISREGEQLRISGVYQMNGQTFDFGPGALGDTVLVQIDNTCTCDDPLQVFTFRVDAMNASNQSFEYDPRVFMAPKQGQCTQ